MLKLESKNRAHVVGFIAICAMMFLAVARANATTVTATTTAQLIADLNAAQSSGATVSSPYVINLSSLATYTVTAVDNTSDEFGDNGLPVVTVPVTINGNDATITRSAAANIPEFRLLQCSAAALKLTNLTISNGLSDDTDVTLSNGIDGGGLEITGDSSAVTLTGCTFTGNSSFQGGGICDDGGGTLTLNSCTITNNSAQAAFESSFGDGGGIACDAQVSNLSMISCTLSGNSSDWGGGSAVFSAAATSIEACNITENTAGGIGIGGAVALTSDTQNAIDTSSIYYNTSSDCPGAGLYNTSPMSVVTNCNVTNNTESGLEPYGGGIFNTGAMLLTNDTIAANLAQSDTQFPGTGGGIQNDGSAIITNCTFDDNAPNAYSAGKTVSSSATSASFLNCILYGDALPEINPASGSGVNIMYSDLQGGAAGTGNIDADPLLQLTLVNNGGDIETQGLGVGSPALSVGTPVGAPATDQRGAPRPNPPSMGSFDSGTVPATFQLPSPVIYVGTGSYTAAQSVTIIDAYGLAKIYYTTDGSQPTVSSTLYVGPITVSGTETITAYAAASSFNSSVASRAVYTFANSQVVPMPTFSPSPGTFTSVQSVTLHDTQSGVSIYYTTDGSPASTSSTKYSTAISVTSSETITAIGVAAGYTSSAIATGNFILNLPVASFTAGLYMISSPFSYPSTPLATLFGYSSPVLAVWAPLTASYSITPKDPANSIVLGQGYWVRFPQPVTITQVGTPAPPSTPFDIQLGAGWNMIGDPWTSTVPLSACTFSNGTITYAQATSEPNLLIGNAFSYNTSTNEYAQAYSLSPIQGYWLYVYSATDMEVPPPGS